jgi:UDP-N-acetylglucosamine--N-acetylmuramyl-(pentapeptide) pyrophosphoryl-undecaprenol N-acetylglucosamine transferase
VVIPDDELTPERLRAEITRLLADEDRLREMGIAARRLAKPDAAQRIAREVLGAAGHMRGGFAGEAEEPPVR